MFFDPVSGASFAGNVDDETFQHRQFVGLRIEFNSSGNQFSELGFQPIISPIQMESDGYDFYSIMDPFVSFEPTTNLDYDISTHIRVKFSGTGVNQATSVEATSIVTAGAAYYGAV